MKTTWKVLALMVLAIFTLSIVPLALAEGGDGTGPEEKKEIEKQLKEKREEIKQQIQEIRENRMEWLKEKSEKIKEEYESKKSELEQLKERRSACGGKDKKNTTDCEEKKLELKYGVQQHLAKTIELIENSYERMVEKINASTGLTEEQKQRLLSQVADLQAKLNEQKEKVVAMSGNSTNQEFKEAIKELKKAWQETKKMEHRLMASLVNSRMDNIAEKHQDFYSAMTTRIAFLEGKGADVTELKALAEKFKQQTAQLNADREAAEVAWVAAADKENLDTAKAATEKVKEDLKQTRETLREFLEKFKELNKEFNNSSSEVENETEVESEDLNSTSNTTEASV